ncbi:helix-turn-helix domain-containing protein [Leptospira levettii]|uniref:Helix-turn-helix domain-containing protein n=1 Tax=Leptospira levettii TaxID=2023178 RepID=A0AAW5VFW2_9LEPT|nr:helix-turn-helix transcriptional regulator [Leptospira levettii]MCW7512126.1 helix-turn-helix domain-containing protein [Leptospira levettii]MCW7517135.1 helix-turn-helix domain-containing protein [Leptospira levettii]
MNFDDFLIKIGKKVKELRISKKLNQEDLDFGDYAVPVRTLQEIEAGRSNFTAKSLFNIAKHLKTKPSDLLDI